MFDSSGDIPLSIVIKNHELQAGTGFLCGRRINKMNEAAHMSNAQVKH